MIKVKWISTTVTKYSIINRLNSEIKIINSIFKFNVKENKLALKLKILRGPNKFWNINFNNKSNELSQRNEINNSITKSNYNKSRSNLILIKDNDLPYIPSLNFSENKKRNENTRQIKKRGNINKTNHFSENLKNYSMKSKKEDCDCFEDNVQNVYKNSRKTEQYNFQDQIKLNLFDYFCYKKNTDKFKQINLYNRGNAFYRKKMDIVYVFTLLSLVEEFINR